jgi:ferredoxin/flavodoxin---NADP+ reductase
VEIYFNEVPEGPLTPRLSDLNPGDEVWLSEKPGGIFTLDTVEPAETLWLLGTGTALGVYLSILRSRSLGICSSASSWSTGYDRPPI